uniref:Uncharacterized protein n=1 Tax=Anguilla anguilla TaxID=7936 RepID=A0A0E9XML2_ANGAN
MFFLGVYAFCCVICKEPSHVGFVCYTSSSGLVTLVFTLLFLIRSGILLLCFLLECIK